MSDQQRERIALQHEMMMRGFVEIMEEEGPKREYGEAYDAFLEQHGLEGRIGNQPENVQEAFEAILGGEDD